MPEKARRREASDKRIDWDQPDPPSSRASSPRSPRTRADHDRIRREIDQTTKRPSGRPSDPTPPPRKQHTRPAASPTTRRTPPPTTQQQRKPSPAKKGASRPTTEPLPDDPTHLHAPRRPVLVVGGGRLGRGLMRRFSNAVIIETDPSKVPALRTEFGAYRVYHGSGARLDHLRMAGLDTAQAVILCTNVDETNYKAASLARERGTAQVIARVEHPDQAPRFRKIGVEPVAAPLSIAVNMMANLLSPERRMIGQGVIAKNAPTEGVPIRDLRLRSDAIIVSILRGEHLITPDPEVRMKAGDVVTVMAEKKDLATALTQVTGRDITLNPLNRLYVPLQTPGALRTVFREAFVLAQYADAEIFVLAPEGAAEVAMEAERLAVQAEIPFQMRLYPQKTFVREVMEEIEKQDRKTDHGGLKDHLFFECIVVEPDRVPHWRRILRRRPLDRFLHRLDHPLLVARNPKRYKEILLVIDNTHRASMTVHHTMDLALVYGSRITALLPESAAGDEAYRLLRHLKQTGKIYGVDVTELRVRGNPTLEFILEVKSGAYDLIVLDWQGRSVKRDILRRVIEYGPRSTLVLP